MRRNGDRSAGVLFLNIEPFSEKKSISYKSTIKKADPHNEALNKMLSYKYISNL